MTEKGAGIALYGFALEGTPLGSGCFFTQQTHSPTHAPVLQAALNCGRTLSPPNKIDISAAPAGERWRKQKL